MERREFLKAGLLTTAAASGLGQIAPLCAEAKTSADEGCRVVQARSEFRLSAPTFRLSLDTATGLCAHSCENKRTGRTISLGGGGELAIDLDAAEERIWIVGWKGTVAHAASPDCDQDPGYKQGFANSAFDDAKWRGMINLAREQEAFSALSEKTANQFTWGRTHVIIPATAREKPLSLTLGGLGAFDHRSTRVFLNGDPVAVRRSAGRWHEPLMIDLGPDSEAHHSVRFGQDNLIAVQLWEFFDRPAHLEELDPRHGRLLYAAWTQFPNVPYEQYLTIGKPLESVEWKPANLISKKEGESGEAVFEVVSNSGALSALVTYRWSASEPVLRKFVEVSNRSQGVVRILQLRLADFATGETVSEGEQGFPVYINGELFTGLGHPYGWAMGQDGRVQLRQYPGTLVEAGKRFECMEAVLGFARQGDARPAFLRHLKSRMRRTVRGHDQAYSILDTYGAQPNGETSNDATEEYVLDNIAKVAAGQRDSNCHFDYYSIEFWVDYHGDLTAPDPKRFPHGFDPIKAELQKLNTKLGLWIDSSWEGWSIGGNPAVKPTFSNDPSFEAATKAMCRATEPIKSMYSRGFRHQIRENGVRLLKFDNLDPICYNPKHDHLPGLYSMERIGNAIIGTLRDLDAENPDVFLMLYWGYRSPWWLLHADTLFEPGLGMEASYPASSPALYARDSVIMGLDQAQWYAADVPSLGKDSLGVWLSSLPWNCSIGKERWQEAFVMDMCRGSLLGQIWTDKLFLSPAERSQAGEFIALLKGQTACFRNSRFILGNPWKSAPYGYVCSDGKRAFLALNNCTWRDVSLDLRLNRSWGLPEATVWNLYRWYPEPAQLRKDYRLPDGTLRFPMRPFEVVLLEAVPAPSGPSLDRTFPIVPMPARASEASRDIPVTASVTPQGLSVEGTLAPCESPGWLAVSVEIERDGDAMLINGVYKQIEAKAQLVGQPVTCTPVVGNNDFFPGCWQAWRVAVDAATRPQPFAFSITNRVKANVDLIAKAHFVPR